MSFFVSMSHGETTGVFSHFGTSFTAHIQGMQIIEPDIFILIFEIPITTAREIMNRIDLYFENTQNGDKLARPKMNKLFANVYGRESYSQTKKKNPDFDVTPEMKEEDGLLFHILFEIATGMKRDTLLIRILGEHLSVTS